MSSVALRWAFHQSVTGPKKAVLVALAGHADATGLCWPTVEHLALFSGYSERSVRSAIKDLQAAKLISVKRGSGHLSSEYRLVLTVYIPHPTVQ